MQRSEIRDVIRANPLLAILRNVPKDILIPYVSSIVESGVHFFEVALNSEGALNEIYMLKKHFDKDIIIGAGTVITVERAGAAIEAGAEFLLSPSADEAVLEYCSKEEIAIIPGALSPSDVSKCIFYGYKDIKLFPAGDLPYRYVKSLKGPFSETEYMAIGGVNEENVQEFIKAGYLGVGMGSNLIPPEVLKSGEWEKVTVHIDKIRRKILDARK